MVRTELNFIRSRVTDKLQAFKINVFLLNFEQICKLQYLARRQENNIRLGGKTALEKLF